MQTAGNCTIGLLHRDINVGETLNFGSTGVICTLPRHGFARLPLALNLFVNCIGFAVRLALAAARLRWTLSTTTSAAARKAL